VAHTELPLHSHLSQVQDSLSVELVARAQAWHAASLVKGTAWGALPLLSAAAPFRAGGHQGPTGYTNIPPGSITRRHVADLYVYPNTLAVVKVSGAELREWLERSAGQFRHIDPNGAAQQPLLAPDHPAFNFDVIEGVEYEIDVTQPRRYSDQGALVAPQAHRIVNLRWGGLPVANDQAFLVATNSYRASGGGYFPGLGPNKVVISTEDDVREIVERYLVQEGVVKVAEDQNWRLLPVKGVALQLRSGPAARAWARAPWQWVSDEPDGWASFVVPAAP
jgi:2',3'-cyclic-nucleotide 2'-phosphodiesterase/3'-nucleotidase